MLQNKGYIVIKVYKEQLDRIWESSLLLNLGLSQSPKRKVKPKPDKLKKALTTNLNRP